MNQRSGHGHLVLVHDGGQPCRFAATVLGVISVLLLSGFLSTLPTRLAFPFQKKPAVFSSPCLQRVAFFFLISFRVFYVCHRSHHTHLARTFSSSSDPRFGDLLLLAVPPPKPYVTGFGQRDFFTFSDFQAVETLSDCQIDHIESTSQPVASPVRNRG